VTIEQMLDRNYTMQGIIHECKRIIFNRVLKEEVKLRGKRGAKRRTAVRLGLHRNTVTRQIQRPSWENAPSYAEISAERDPPI
jgi:hypothetical protein